MATFGVSGTYKKDKDRSDPQDKLFDKFETPWLLRKAAGLLATLKVSLSLAAKQVNQLVPNQQPALRWRSSKIRRQS